MSDSDKIFGLSFIFATTFNKHKKKVIMCTKALAFQQCMEDPMVVSYVKKCGSNNPNYNPNFL